MQGGEKITNEVIQAGFNRTPDTGEHRNFVNWGQAVLAKFMLSNDEIMRHS